MSCREAGRAAGSQACGRVAGEMASGRMRGLRPSVRRPVDLCGVRLGRRGRLVEWFAGVLLRRGLTRTQMAR